MKLFLDANVLFTAAHNPGGKDRPVFQAALGCGASHLLTGDLKHFGLFNTPRDTSGIHIQTVAAFLESLSG